MITAMPENRRRQRGVALITTLLVVTLVVIVANNMIWSDFLQQRRAANLLSTDQALLYGFGAEDWISVILREDAENSEVDHLGEDWAVALPPLPLDNGQMEGYLEDAQARFNVNNLITAQGEMNEQSVAYFRRLLVSLELDPALATIVVDWLDANIDVTYPDGAEDDTYTSLEQPYRTPNTVITSISELMAVKGFDQAILDVLRPHITALPMGTTINVNTASPAVLAALSEDWSVNDGENMAETREVAPYEDLADIQSEIDPQQLQSVGVASRFFRATMLITLGTTQLTMYSLLERDPATGSVIVRLRSFASD